MPPVNVETRFRKAKDDAGVGHNVLKYKETYDLYSRSARCALFAGIAGGLFAVLETLKSNCGKRINRQIGFAPFPNEHPEDLVLPLLDSPYAVADCRERAPQRCEDDVNCRQNCGPGYRCQEAKTRDTLINGHALVLGKKYCLPERHSHVNCKPGTGVLTSRFDPAHPESNSFECSCKYPDIFAGYSCDKMVACADPSDPTNHAPLVDRTTGLDVDLDDTLFLESKDLYERMPDGSPRFYCRCKAISPLLTSAIDPLRCMRDPCLPLFLTSKPGENKSVPHPSVTGWPDGAGGNMRLECGCGDSRVTRLFGGGENPCLPIMDRNCGKVSFHPAYKGNRCDCGPDEIFVPCRNRYRPDAVHLPLCGTDGSYMIRTDAPEAGACVKVCELCDRIVHKRGRWRGNLRFTSVCQDSLKTVGRCRVEKSLPLAPLLPGSEQHMFGCDCGVQDWASFWQVKKEVPASGPCSGYKPPCKSMFGSCDPEGANGFPGAECCHCPYSCGSLFGKRLCLLDFRCVM
jgi:hypothetical protein